MTEQEEKQAERKALLTCFRNTKDRMLGLLKELDSIVTLESEQKIVNDLIKTTAVLEMLIDYCGGEKDDSEEQEAHIVN